MTVVSPAFSTGFHLGDAIYRDLLKALVVGVFGQHWHTGIYTGFEYERGRGFLRAVHAAAGAAAVAGLTDCIFECSAPRSFADPAMDVAGEMQGLRQDFIAKFCDHDPNCQFHGSRRVPGLTPAQRRAIADTAYALLRKDIRYTAADMMNYKWNPDDPNVDWNGGIDMIWNIRCDGVVEYCYERNGVQVCSGGTAALWNIANPGAEHLRNHNDFHDGGYEAGELCPRIQAGDQSDQQHHGAQDTTFVADDPTDPPQISGFTVAMDRSMPAVTFSIGTSAYDDVFVRLTVSKDGGRYYFVRTEELSTRADPSAVAADWRFHVVPTGDTIHARWVGKTVGKSGAGPDYMGQDGDFTFRVVAVDRGGNVSALQETTLTIQWP